MGDNFTKKELQIIEESIPYLRRKLQEDKRIPESYKVRRANANTPEWHAIANLLDPCFNKKLVADTERYHLVSGAIQRLREILKAENPEISEETTPKINSTQETSEQKKERPIFEPITNQKEPMFNAEQLQRMHDGAKEVQKQDDLVESALKGEIGKETFLKNSKFYR